MFWMLKKAWIEAWIIIVIAAVVSVIAWINIDTPGQLQLEITTLEREVEWLENKKVEPLEEFKECIHVCMNWSNRLLPGFTVPVRRTNKRLTEKTKFLPDNMTNRRFEFLLTCNRGCFIK